MEQAQKLMARIMSVPLDRQRPLWEMWLFRLRDGRIGIIQKTHHALIDGMSGVDVGTVMLDFGPEPVQTEVQRYEPQAPPSRAQLVRDAIGEIVRKPNEAVEALFNRRDTADGSAREQAFSVAKGLLSFGKASLEFAPRTPLCTPIGAHRRFEIVRADLADVKRIKRHFECTVNDVVLASVAGGIGGLLRSRGEVIDGLVMKAMVPVSVRDPSQRMTYGNKVSMMAAELPVGERDPGMRVRFVRERMRGLKESKQAVGADFWVKLSEYAPPTVLALAARATALQRMINLVVTNVPGPQFPLYLKGAKMIEAFPCVPILGTAAIGVAVLSYNGAINFGLNGDWDVVPDLNVLAAEINASLEQLAALAPRVEDESASGAA
jgi:WS/DGAT/MGAT family acyltransferase